MSLTPLHIGAGYGLRKKMSYGAFIATNILMDLPVVVAVLNDLLGDSSPPGGGIHDLHTVGYAAVVAIVVWLALRTRAAVIGAVAGVASHLLIDAIYHPDVMPEWGLYGLISQNAMDLLLAGIFILPVGWECFQRLLAKRTNKGVLLQPLIICPKASASEVVLDVHY